MEKVFKEKQVGKKTINLNEELYSYLLEVSLREPKLAYELRMESEKMLASALQSPPEESQFISLLIKLINAKRIIEIGTFTGYTTLLMANQLPENGRIIACDIDEKWVNIGKKYWEAAGVANKIDVSIGPAIDTMNQLIKDGFMNSFDFIFIDADKENYLNYYTLARKLIKIGGTIGVDNVLWNGAVLNKSNNSKEVQSIRSLNEWIYNDEDFDISILPIGDGLTLAYRIR